MRTRAHVGHRPGTGLAYCSRAPRPALLDRRQKRRRHALDITARICCANDSTRTCLVLVGRLGSITISRDLALLRQRRSPGLAPAALSVAGNTISACTSTTANHRRSDDQDDARRADARGRPAPQHRRGRHPSTAFHRCAHRGQGMRDRPQPGQRTTLPGTAAGAGTAAPATPLHASTTASTATSASAPNPSACSRTIRTAACAST